MYQNEIERIIIHHTWSKDNLHKYDWDTIRAYHKSLGWNDIGYHWGVELVKDKLQIVRGRPEFIIGAHCYGHNQNTLGIALVGNYDIAEPSKEAMELLARLCCSRLHKHPSIIAIEPHHKYNSGKTCPGKLFDMNKLLYLIENYKEGLPDE